MRRPHLIAEVALKVRRQRAEFFKHVDRDRNTMPLDRDGRVCHCLRGLGAVRKNRPWGKPCSPGRCPMCEAEREEKRTRKKRLRAAGRREETSVP